MRVPLQLPDSSRSESGGANAMAIDYVVDAPISARRPRRRTMAGPYPALGFAGALLIATTTPQWRLDQKTWRLTLPFLPFDGTRPFTAFAFVAGAASLGIAMLGVIGGVE